MTKQDIATLSFKVLSIYAIIHAFNKLPSLFNYMLRSNAFDELSMLNFMPQAVPIILILICGILLWYCAPLLAATIFKSNLPEEKSETTLRDIQITAFMIIGLFVIASSLTDITRDTLFDLFLTSSRYGADQEMKNVRVAYLVLFVTKVSFGLWLLLGARGIANFIMSLRRD
jgi:hypothetical protein